MLAHLPILCYKSTFLVVLYTEYYMLMFSGGGFGGKETRTFLLSTPTAVAAHK